MSPVVRAGVSVFLYDERGLYVLMLRRGSHGAFTWGLPGGHIEFEEGAREAAVRELYEELGVIVNADNLDEVGWSEAVFPDDGKHYITVLFKAPLPPGAEPRILEPEKCGGLLWAAPEDARQLPLFSPLLNFLDQHGTPCFRPKERCAGCISKNEEHCPHVYSCPRCGRGHACLYPPRDK